MIPTVLVVAALLAPESEGAAFGESSSDANAPSSQTLARLREQSRHHYALVWCREGRFELPKAQFDSTGVWSRDRTVYRAPRQAVLQSADAVRMKLPPKPIRWDSIDSIAVAKRAAGPVVATVAIASIGFAVGLAVFGIVLGSTHELHGEAIAGVAVPLTIAGALALTSLAAREHRTVVYRAGVDS